MFLWPKLYWFLVWYIFFCLHIFALSLDILPLPLLTLWLCMSQISGLSGCGLYQLPSVTLYSLHLLFLLVLHPFPKPCVNLPYMWSIIIYNY